MTDVVSSPAKSTRHHDARAYPLVAEWLDHLAYRDLADATRDSYERTLAEFILWRDRDFADYTAWDVEAFLGTKNAASRRKHKAAFASIYKFARRRGYVSENVMELVDDVRRPGQRVPNIFSEGEVERLCGLPAPNGQLCTLLLYTGIRKSEARMLQRNAITLDPLDDEGHMKGGHVVVMGKGRKERIVEFMGRAAAAISELDVLEGLNPTDYLWCNRLYDPPLRERPIADSTFQRWWGGGPGQMGVLEMAGVPYRNIHMTRHTFATRLIRRGARLERVKKLLGHASIATTSDYYGHLTIEDVREDLALLES